MDLETKTKTPFPQYIDPNPKKHFHWAIFVIIVLGIAAGLLVAIEKFKTDEEINSFALTNPGVAIKSLDRKANQNDIVAFDLLSWEGRINNDIHVIASKTQLHYKATVDSKEGDHELVVIYQKPYICFAKGNFVYFYCSFENLASLELPRALIKGPPYPEGLSIFGKTYPNEEEDVASKLMPDNLLASVISVVERAIMQLHSGNLSEDLEISYQTEDTREDIVLATVRGIKNADESIGIPDNSIDMLELAKGFISVGKAPLISLEHETDDSKFIAFVTKYGLNIENYKIK